MVKKIIKHEIASSFKSFSPVFIMGFIGALIFTYILNFSMNVDSLDNSTTLVITLVSIILVGLVVASLVLSILGLLQVSYKSLYSLTGYRQFTYPITSSQRIIVKLVTSLFWAITTSLYVMLMIGLALLITTIINEPIAQIFNYAWRTIKEVFTSFDLGWFALANLETFMGLVLQIMVILFAGAFANASMFRKNRPLVAFITYIVAMIVFSNVSNILEFLLFDHSITNFSILFAVGDSLLSKESMIFAAALNLVYSGILAYLTIWLWENKLEILN